MEEDLLRKLATEWHLNVSERSALPNGVARASVLRRVVEEELRNNGWFPSNWRPEDAFDGGLLELKSENEVDLYWKSEVGMMRFELKEINHYSSISKAVTAFIKGFFNSEIDGIKIDWAA